MCRIIGETKNRYECAMSPFSTGPSILRNKSNPLLPDVDFLYNYLDIVWEGKDADKVVYMKIIKYESHGLLQLLNAASVHGAAYVQQECDVFPQRRQIRWREEVHEVTFIHLYTTI